MKILKRIFSGNVYGVFFVMSAVQFLYIPFSNNAWRDFFSGAVCLFVGLVIWGTAKSEK